MDSKQRLTRLHQVVSEANPRYFSIGDPAYCVMGHAHRDEILYKEGFSELYLVEQYQDFFGLTEEEVVSFFVPCLYEVSYGEAAKREALLKIEKLFPDNVVMVVYQRKPWTHILPILLLCVILL